MRRLLETVLTGALAAGTVVGGTLSDALVQKLESGDRSTQRVIVMMKDAEGAQNHIRGLSQDRATLKEAMQQNAALAQASLLEAVDQMGIDGSANVQTNWLINSVILDATPAQIQALQDRDDVKHIELNETIQLETVVSSVPEGKRAQGDDEVSTWGLKAIKALEARSTYAVDGSGVVVGILDTGFDGQHPLLAGKCLRWKSFDGGDQPEPVDDNGHGSHCAGTIGGSSGGGMEIGVAPGVQFVAAKIFSGSGGATTEGIAGAMAWVVDPDGIPNSGDEPRLVSNSWGSGPGRTVFLEAVKNWRTLGIAPIFAAGNSGPGARTVGSPGDFLESYAVGATTVTNTIASFSSRGPSKWDGVEYIKPDISAPGKDVTSVKAGGEYWTISGTSMATPHVAGLAALLYQANPDLTIDELTEAISSTSIEAGPEGKDNDFGFGRIDAMAALGIVATGGKITGSVKDASGNGIPHAKVVVNETGVKVRLAADGSFRMTLPEGTYSLSVKAFGYLATSVDGIVVTAGEESDVAIAMDAAASGTVAGTLKGAGTPVEGTIQVLETPLAPVQSDASGAFSLSLPAGTYKVAASAYGFESTVSGEFAVAANGTTDLDLDLAKLPPVLVVDDDAGKDYETYFTAALGETGHNLVAYADVEGLMSGNFLAQYEMVVWLTGADYKATLTDADQAAIAAYLDMGGRLFVSGQDIGYQLKSKAFLAERLGAKFVKDSSSSKTVSGGDLAFQIEGGDGANNQKYADVLEAAGNGVAFLNYGTGSVAAVKVVDGNSKVVYFGFGLEGIDSAANRSAAMGAVIDFLKPTAAEMAARVEALQSRPVASEQQAHDDALLGQALTNLVSTRLQAEGADLSGSDSRQIRRMGAFEALSR